MRKWHIHYGGGTGDNVWHADLTGIEAPTLRAALDIAEPGILRAAGDIDLIEEEE